MLAHFHQKCKVWIPKVISVSASICLVYVTVTSLFAVDLISSTSITHNISEYIVIRNHVLAIDLEVTTSVTFVLLFESEGLLVSGESFCNGAYSHIVLDNVHLPFSCNFLALFESYFDNCRG